MQRKLRGIAILLFCILLTMGIGNEPVFDFSLRWSTVFIIIGIFGFALCFWEKPKK